MERIDNMQMNPSQTKGSKFKKNSFEMEAWSLNKLVCGIDEVGRGCLAGPLVTAAVILPLNKTNRLLKDSKLTTPEERLKAYTWITKHCWYGVGIVHNRIIDQHNIYRATLIAMKRALVNLLATTDQYPEAILVDAMPLELSDTSYKGIPVHHFPKGERKSSSIAAASIVAKVTRDAMMTRFDPLFPGFHLASHKGYSTEKHKGALLIQKPTIIHRKSFLNNINAAIIKGDHDGQQSLC
ncbi:MAG TPA: ribonuclease HII [Candidatus Babeliales bacterium]|nr:ribonuclease HII [Candidatus Babeliales bacterium]